MTDGTRDGQLSDGIWEISGTVSGDAGAESARRVTGGADGVDSLSVILLPNAFFAGDAARMRAG